MPEICDALGKEYHNFLAGHVSHMVLAWHHTAPVHVTVHNDHADCQEQERIHLPQLHHRKAYSRLSEVAAIA